MSYTTAGTRPRRRAVITLGLAAFAFGCSLVGATGEQARAEDRADLSLPQSLVGHWRTHSSKAEYYFSADGGLVMTEDNGTKQQVQKYEVIKSEEDEEVLRVKVTVPSTGGGHEKELRFASNRLSLMSTVRTEIKGRTYVVNVTWHYVDDAQRPPVKGDGEKG